MLEFRNQSDTLIIVLHEIYGINAHITEVCRSLSDRGYDVVCPDLLDGKPPFDYESEAEAYRYFMNYAGFDSSVKKVIFLMRNEENDYKRIFLLGYSVGATAAWLSCSDSACSEAGYPDGMPMKKLSGMIAYYGSRIRDYPAINPICPALLFFSEEESFDPAELRSELEKKKAIEVHILKGKHGFSDPHSDHYHQASADIACRIRNEFLERTGQERI